jgi:hypothetical protein
MFSETLFTHDDLDAFFPGWATTLLFRARSTANLISSSCSKRREIMMKASAVNNTRNTGRRRESRPQTSKNNQRITR